MVKRRGRGEHCAENHEEIRGNFAIWNLPESNPALQFRRTGWSRLGGFVMVRQLMKVGDGWALALDEQLLRDLNITGDTWLEVMPHGHSIMVAPARIEGGASADPILDKIHRRYRHMFIRLAW